MLLLHHRLAHTYTCIIVKHKIVPMRISVFLSILYIYSYIYTPSVVEVNFKECSYTVTEGEGQVSVSLRIDGRFFVPVWAIVEISDGTATGGCACHSSSCMYITTISVHSCLYYFLPM